MRKELRHKSNKQHRDVKMKTYVDDTNYYGIKQSDMKGLVEEFTPRIKRLGVKRFIPIAEKLLQDEWFEESDFALRLMKTLQDKFDKDTLTVFEKWIDKYITSWVLCDKLSAGLISPLLKSRPSTAKSMIMWAASKDRMKKRAAIGSFMLHARRGNFLDYIFLISEMMIKENDDMLQKLTGLLLKEASKSGQREVLEFLKTRKHKMPKETFNQAAQNISEKTRKIHSL